MDEHSRRRCAHSRRPRRRRRSRRARRRTGGTVLSARRLLIATGRTDELPEIPGLAARGVPVIAGEAAGVESDGGDGGDVEGGEDRLVGLRLASGELLPAEVLVVATRMLANIGVFEPLGVRTEENPMGRFVSVDALGRTSVTGVWAAGNASDLSAQVGAAAAAGTLAGAQLNAELVMEGL